MAMSQSFAAQSRWSVWAAKVVASTSPPSDATIPTMAEIDEQLARAVEAIPGIAAMAVFGSRASGSARPDSDLDVAILPSREGVSRRTLQVSVAVALADLAPEGRVDVVMLDEAPELLRHNVLSTGRLVLCRDAQAWKDLRVETMREHGDREWARDLLRRAQQRRLERGEPGSRSGHAVQSLRRTRNLPR
jgi:predicted nucleotidyltransferase